VIKYIDGFEGGNKMFYVLILNKQTDPLSFDLDNQ